MVREGAIKGNDGKAQGTVIFEVMDAISTDDTGHWLHGSYVMAIDAHVRWWM